MEHPKWDSPFDHVRRTDDPNGHALPMRVGDEIKHELQINNVLASATGILEGATEINGSPYDLITVATGERFYAGRPIEEVPAQSLTPIMGSPALLPRDTARDAISNDSLQHIVAQQAAELDSLRRQVAHGGLPSPTDLPAIRETYDPAPSDLGAVQQTGQPVRERREQDMEQIVSAFQYLQDVVLDVLARR